MNDKTSVLVVDDDENIRNVFTRALTSAGFLCQTAQDGPSGLEALRGADFDVALIDLRMPGLDGIELLTLLLKEKIPTVPIVVSGYGDVSKAVTVMKLGAFDFLEKPSSPEAVVMVTERAAAHSRLKRYAREMAELAEEWEITFDASPDLIVVLDRHQKIVRCNRALASRVGMEKEILTGKSCHEVFCGTEHDSGECPFTTLSECDRPEPIEFSVTAWGGWFELVGVPLASPSGTRWGSVYILHDITDRKRIEQILEESRSQARRFAAHLQEVREEERARIAREIHDELGQLLTALDMDLSRLRKLEAPDWNEVTLRIAAMQDLVEMAEQTVHKVATELRPSILDDLGLVSAVEWATRTFEEHFGIRVHLDLDRNLVLDKERSTAFFRILQEALTNVVRHARASEVRVSLFVQGNHTVLEVADDGVGIRPPEIERSDGFGLIGMRERAEFLGGTMTIEGEPGKGSSIRVSIPGTDRGTTQ